MTTSTKLEKAYLALIEPPKPANKAPSLSSVLNKAKAGGVGEVVFTFNPKDFTISKSAKWTYDNQKNQSRTTMPQFTGSDPASMTLEIFLDSSEGSPTVARDVQRLIDCVTPLAKTLSEKKPSPPWVVFGWGKFISFVALVKQVQAKYTRFLPDGTPIRAVCTVTLEEVPTDPPPRQNPTSGGRSAHRTHRVVAGDTLPSIAQREYGDPSLWRALAETNGIDDPLRVGPGTQLMVPLEDELRV